ncbi:MAG: ribonuclease Z [Candidatus Woesearchaeota archaeon]|nr:MAG: ribonuclease Z [Candidatus Woesearchaeota archaeon]
MEITFLGTSAMLPTKNRNPTAVLLSYSNENFLFDCAEGTQRQMRIKGISPTKITKILISHWHGDHILGLPGIIQSLGAGQYKKTLNVYGPKGTRQNFQNMFSWFSFPVRIDIKVHEIEKDGKFFENEEFMLEAYKLDHGIACLGYSFIEKDRRRINLEYLKKFDLKKHPILKELQKGKDIEWKGKKISVDKATIVKKGKKIAFVTDTAYTNNIIKAAKDADVLICESTWMHQEDEKTFDYKHLTTAKAAKAAKEAKVDKLILTHFSQRYRDTKEIEAEAKKTFKNTICAKDFDVFSV